MPSYLITGASRGLGNSVYAVSQITGGSLDYVIANAGLIPLWSAWDSVDILLTGNVRAQSPQLLDKDLLESFKVNVIGNFHLFNLFTPLVLKGRGKKVVAISSGMSDVDFIREFEIEPAAPYAISKAGTSVVTAKFASRGFEGEMTEEQIQKAQKLARKFVNYAPHHKGPSSPEESARAVLSVMHEASLEKGSSGAFVSRYGNKQWM
ncbi:hypothetical protein FAVG1_02528 [Fusarium avenaceum]|nr:hypothetical protein FAVG1_02528 [Fusarium avenaceum]